MPHISMSHMIGTISLLGILIIVGLVSSSIDLDLRARTQKGNLQDIAQFVSNELVSVTTLTESSQKSDLFSYKFISVPTSVGTKGYTVSIVNDTTLGWEIVASLDGVTSIYGASPLNFRGGIIVGTDTNPPPLNFTTPVRFVSSFGSGTNGTLVWCYYNTTTSQSWVGLGVLP